MTFRLIGLTGPAGCGKDTVANHLCHTHSFRKIALADPIRRGIAAMFKIPEAHMTSRDLKELPLDELCGRSPRQLMQTLGTEWGRQMVHQDVWLNIAQFDIDYTKKLIAGKNSNIKGIVVSDVRFPDEARWIKAQGGILCHIYRGDNPHGLNTTHASEIPIRVSLGDLILINDKDIDHLITQTNMTLMQHE